MAENSSIQRLPPQNVEAEVSVLGSLMLDKDAIIKVADVVSQKHLKQNFVPINAVLSATFERIDELHRDQGKLRGLATGFVDLDQKLGGLQKSDLVILAARPSMGKTSMALDIMRHVGVDLK